MGGTAFLVFVTLGNRGFKEQGVVMPSWLQRLRHQQKNSGGVVMSDMKPPAQLARVVALTSHPYKRGGGIWRLFFVVRNRPQ